MLERALSKALANFSTLFLVACVITIPVNVAQAYVFRDALAVRELAPEIQRFPEGRQVRGVARAELDREKSWSLILLAVQLLLFPLVHRAARRVLAVADDGGVPDVVDAYANLAQVAATKRAPSPVALASGAIFAAVCGWMVWRVGVALADMLSAHMTWAGTALARAAAVATALALAAGTAAGLAGEANTRAHDAVPEGY